MCAEKLFLMWEKFQEQQRTSENLTTGRYRSDPDRTVLEAIKKLKINPRSMKTMANGKDIPVKDRER